MTTVEDFAKRHIRVRFGRSAEPFIPQAAELIHSVFEGQNVPLPSKNLMMACHKKNTAAFIVVQPRGEDRISCVVEMYPLHMECLTELLSGTISESDIRIDHVIEQGRPMTGGLYVAITGPAEPGKNNGPNVLAAIDGTIEVLNRCYGSSASSFVDIYALDATAEGRTLIEDRRIFGDFFAPLEAINLRREKSGFPERAWHGRYHSGMGEHFRRMWQVFPGRFAHIQEW